MRFLTLLAPLALVATAPALAENLNPAAQRHSVECVLAHACAMKKPADIGSWELLTKDVVLQEKAEGHWLADLSKLKSIAQKKATFHVMSLQGKMVEVNVKLVDKLTVTTPDSALSATSSKAAPRKKIKRQKPVTKCD